MIEFTFDFSVTFMSFIFSESPNFLINTIHYRPLLIKFYMAIIYFNMADILQIMPDSYM